MRQLRMMVNHLSFSATSAVSMFKRGQSIVVHATDVAQNLIIIVNGSTIALVLKTMLNSDHSSIGSADILHLTASFS